MALDEAVLHKSYRQFEGTFDSESGGFGDAPKFPAPHQLTYLLRYHRWTGEEKALEMVTKTLDSMADGGIYDHIGYGFARYSVDEKWLVPHFEKMLYDQAMLTIAYTEAYQVTSNERYRRVAEEILAYVSRELLSSEGGFYSAEDADSEGVEGKFYVWDKEEILEILGREAGEAFCAAYNITPEGNFEGRNIPNLIGRDGENSRFGKERRKLFAAREERVHPHKDDKILTSWNGLMIAAFAKAGRVFQNEDDLDIADGALDFIKNFLTVNGRLMARYRDGEVKFKGYIDDYANCLWANLEMYESTFDAGYLEKSVDLAEGMTELFWDEEEGGFFFYGKDSEPLMTRPKELYDAAVPSGNSVAAVQLLRLAKLTGQIKWEKMAAQMNEVFAGEASHYPNGYSYFLQNLLIAKMDGKEVVVLGEEESESYKRIVDFLQRGFLPEVVYAATDDPDKLSETVSFIKNFRKGPETKVFVCENFSCQRPVTNVDRVMAHLNP
ncbi:MAG TPA: thioredoxin domain-containing protein [Bacillales bacterium]|nr:thioredoxin domain-containing protein [Bacillales bacterium]